MNTDKFFTYQISEQGHLEAIIINMESTITMKYGVLGLYGKVLVAGGPQG